MNNMLLSIDNNCLSNTIVSNDEFTRFTTKIFNHIDKILKRTRKNNKLKPEEKIEKSEQEISINSAKLNSLKNSTKNELVNNLYVRNFVGNNSDSLESISKNYKYKKEKYQEQIKNYEKCISAIQKEIEKNALNKDCFSDILFSFIEEKGYTDATLYKKAGISRQVFSNIRKGSTPTKSTALKFAFALELKTEEMERLIGSAGYILLRNNAFDILIKRCFDTEYYIFNNYEAFNVFFNVMSKLNEMYPSHTNPYKDWSFGESKE